MAFLGLVMNLSSLSLVQAPPNSFIALEYLNPATFATALLEIFHRFGPIRFAPLLVNVWHALHFLASAFPCVTSAFASSFANGTTSSLALSSAVLPALAPCSSSISTSASATGSFSSACSSPYIICAKKVDIVATSKAASRAASILFSRRGSRCICLFFRARVFVEFLWSFFVLYFALPIALRLTYKGSIDLG